MHFHLWKAGEKVKPHSTLVIQYMSKPVFIAVSATVNRFTNRKDIVVWPALFVGGLVG